MRDDIELLRDALKALNSRDAFLFAGSASDNMSSHDLAHEITLRLLWLENDKKLTN